MYPVLPRILFARCVDVFVEDLFVFSFRFKARETYNALGIDVFDILITSKGASALGMFNAF